MRIVKVHKKLNILNEDGLSAGYNQVGYNTLGFSYAILPLSTNLCQKGNDPEPSNKNKCFKHFNGDMVKGICPYDNKKHLGIIKYMYYKDNNEKPLLVYIQDLDNNDTVPLLTDTIRSVKVEQPLNIINHNYMTSNPTEIDHDFQAISPVKESYDFNNIGLMLDNSVELTIIKKSSSNISNEIKHSTVLSIVKKYLIDNKVCEENEIHIDGNSLKIINDYDFILYSILIKNNSFDIVFNSDTYKQDKDLYTCIKPLINNGYQFNNIIYLISSLTSNKEDKNYILKVREQCILSILDNMPNNIVVAYKNNKNNIDFSNTKEKIYLYIFNNYQETIFDENTIKKCIDKFKELNINVYFSFNLLRKNNNYIQYYNDINNPWKKSVGLGYIMKTFNNNSTLNRLIDDAKWAVSYKEGERIDAKLDSFISKYENLDKEINVNKMILLLSYIVVKLRIPVYKDDIYNIKNIFTNKQEYIFTKIYELHSNLKINSINKMIDMLLSNAYDLDEMVDKIYYTIAYYALHENNI